MIFKKKEKSGQISQIQEQTERLPRPQEILTKSLDSIIKSKITWYGWCEQFVFPKTIPSTIVATNVLRVIEKYFPDATISTYSHASALIEHPEHGFGEVELSDLGINDVLHLLQTDLVKKLFIHKDTEGKLDNAAYVYFKPAEGTNRYLQLWIDAPGISKWNRRKYQRESADVPLSAELFISPAEAETKPLFDRLYFELDSFTNPLLDKGFHQYLDTTSLYR